MAGQDKVEERVKEPCGFQRDLTVMVVDVEQASLRRPRLRLRRPSLRSHEDLEYEQVSGTKALVTQGVGLPKSFDKKSGVIETPS